MKRLFRLLIIIFVFAFLAYYFINSIEVKYKDEIDLSCAEYGLDKELVYAVIMTESGYSPSAISGKGAVGLMQITEDTAVWCTEKMGNKLLAAEITQPDVNIRVGCFYLKYLLTRYNGEESTALAAYNAGAGNVDEWLKDSRYSEDGKTLVSSPFEETKNYMKKVLLYKRLYKLLY